jgi:hypothetical protein
MYKKERTGILEVSSPDGEWQIHLVQGAVVNAVTVEGRRWLLGDLLTGSGVLTEAQLLRADKRASADGRPVEAVLLESGAVSPDILKRMLDLQVRETLFPLFNRIGTTCRFSEDPPRPLEGLVPIPIPYVLKEAERRLREWPDIQKIIPHPEAVYGRVAGTATEVLGGEPDPPAPDEDDETERLTANDQMVYYYLNRKKTVAQVALATGLGEHETMKSLVHLRRERVVELVAERGAGEKNKERTIFPALVRLLFYAVLLAGIGGLLGWRLGLLGAPVDSLLPARQAAAESVVRQQQSRIESALELYHLERGYYPDALDDLEAQRYLYPGELSDRMVGVDWRYTPGEGRQWYQLSHGSQTSR